MKSHRHHIGLDLITFDEVGSTNDLARYLAWESGCRPGTVILARQQTTGRGQYGRVWQSRRDSSLLMSIIVPELKPTPRPVVLTAWLSCALARTLRQLQAPSLRLKWPNDILVQERKIAGLLIEQSAGVQRHVIVAGLGLNINQTAEEFQQLGLTQATAIEQICPGPQSRELILETILNELDQGWSQLVAQDYSTLEGEWQSLLQLQDQPVVAITTHGEHIPGVLRTLSFQQIELHRDDGSSVSFIPENLRGLQRKTVVQSE